MKRCAYLLVTGLLLFALGSCSSGTENPENQDPPVDKPETGELVLVVNRPDIVANGKETVRFTVTRGDLDKTTQAKIWQIGTDGKETALTTNTFSSKELGSYTFEARYTDPKGVALVSPKVTVNAIEMPKEEFLRRVALQQFTSVLCKFCPDVTDIIIALRNQEIWKDRIVHLTFHTSGMGKDPMIIPTADQYFAGLKIEGLPSLTFDLMPHTHLGPGKATTTNVVDQLNRTIAEYPAMCGVAITSNYDEATRQVTINAKIKATKSDEYRVLVFLLEDRIYAPQLGRNDFYPHDDTIRQLVSQSAYGDKLGIILAKSEKAQTYTVTLKEGWLADKMHVAVCALHDVDGNFYINNSAVCPLINGAIDYTYNPQN